MQWNFNDFIYVYSYIWNNRLPIFVFICAVLLPLSIAVLIVYSRRKNRPRYSKGLPPPTNFRNYEIMRNAIKDNDVSILVTIPANVYSDIYYECIRLNMSVEQRATDVLKSYGKVRGRF